MERIIASLLCISMLAGCASDASIQQLTKYQRDCAYGDKGACYMVPIQKAANENEAAANGAKALAIGILIPLAVGAVVLGAAAEERANRRCYNGYYHHYYDC